MSDEESFPEADRRREARERYEAMDTGDLIRQVALLLNDIRDTRTARADRNRVLSHIIEDLDLLIKGE